MAILDNLRVSRVKLAAVRLQLRSWIGISRTRHGRWVKTRSLADLTSWHASVQKVRQLNAKVQAYEQYLKLGATTSTTNVAQSIGVWEGGRSRDGLFHPYQDEVGVWTIGYGHTNSDGDPHVGPSTRPLTLEEAVTLLHHDLNVQYAPAVHRALKSFGWKVNQRMFDALTSFAYNLGPGYFSRGHTIGDAMARRDAGATANAMLVYNKAGGRVLPGLDRRRHWEKQLFLGGTYHVSN